MRAISLVCANSLKYNEFLGKAQLPGLVANSIDKSFPLGLVGPFKVGGSSSRLHLGEGSGVLWTLVLGVELNSEQIIEPESLQPVLSSTGAVKISETK